MIHAFSARRAYYDGGDYARFERAFVGTNKFHLREIEEVQRGPPSGQTRNEVETKTMSERTLASLDAAVTELETWKEYLSGNITQIQDDEANYKSELNTFYLMWAGTPLPRLCLRDVH